MKQSETRSVYLSFDFDKDASRRRNFLIQAENNCEFKIKDLSLPAAVHSKSWQREALALIRKSDVVIVLLGEDTHSALGVRDELSLAGQTERPVIQLLPQRRPYAAIGKNACICNYRWNHINKMLQDPQSFCHEQMNPSFH